MSETEIKNLTPINICIAAIAVGVCIFIAFYDPLYNKKYPSVKIEKLPYSLPAEKIHNLFPQAGKFSSFNSSIICYANTQLFFNFDFPQTDNASLFLIARGTPSNDIFPAVDISIDHSLAAEFYVVSSQWGLYRVPLNLSPGKHLIEIAFINDQTDYPEDRNLEIKELIIEKKLPTKTEYYRWQAPCFLIPGKMSVQNFALPQSDGPHIWNYGFFADDVYFAAPGNMTLSIYAAGLMPGGESQALEVSLDGQKQANIILDQEGLNLYSSPINIKQAGLHRIAFTNRSPQQRRNPEADIIFNGAYLGELPPAGIPQRAIPTINTLPSTFNAKDFDFQSTGNAGEHGWVLWTNGYIKQNFILDQRKTFKLSIFASGYPCQNEWSRLKVMLDRDQIASFNVSAKETKEYSISATLDKGRHSLFLIFDNDLQVKDSCDRNLIVDSITFGE